MGTVMATIITAGWSWLLLAAGYWMATVIMGLLLLD